MMKNILHQKMYTFINATIPPKSLFVILKISLPFEYSSIPYPIAIVIKPVIRNNTIPVITFKKFLFCIFIIVPRNEEKLSVNVYATISAITIATMSVISAITPLSYPILKRAIKDRRTIKSIILYDFQS